jgi:hypothetical protein
MEKKSAMGKKVFRFLKIWGNIVLGAIAIYPFIVAYFIPSKAQGELTSLFGSSWQTWLIIFLVSIILTLLTQNWIEKFDKETNTLSTIASANHEGVAMQGVNNSPVVKASGTGVASGRDTILTQNFFPPNNPQIISLPAISGNMEFRHPSPRPDPQGNETECKIVVINNSGQSFSKCAAYIAEVAHKSKKDKQWLVLSDVPSGQPLKWDSMFSSLDGFISIDNGHQETLSLFEAQTKIFSRDGSTYKYFLTFYRSIIPLLHETATSHRILIRFHGGQTFGGVSVEKKIYVYLNEIKPGFKVFAGIEEFKS